MERRVTVILPRGFDQCYGARQCAAITFAQLAGKLIHFGLTTQIR
jgi:hypothetical protein